MHTFGGGSHLGDWDGPGRKYKKSLEFQLKFDFGNFFIAGAQTPPPPTVVHSLKKYFLVVRFWWNKSQNLGLGLNFLFVNKKFWKSFQLFPKNQKQNFQKSANFGLNFFFCVRIRKHKFFDFWYHFGDRPKKLGKIFKINFFLFKI